MLLVIPKFVILLFITGMIHHSIQISSYRSLIRTKRIANGYNVKIRKFPYFVSLITKKLSDDGMFPADLQFCGASIISKNWAISTASCFYRIYRLQVPVSDWFVRSGTTFWNATKQRSKYVRDHDVANYYIAAQWYVGDHSPWGDVALIQIEPTKLIAVGFGQTENYYTSYRLKAVKLHTVPIKDCGSIYHMFELNTLRCVKSSKFSANACEGDYGGPVTQYRHGMPVLVGMVYRGPVNCGNPKKPAIVKDTAHSFVQSMVEYFQTGAKFTNASFNN